MIDVIAILDYENYEQLFDGAHVMGLDIIDEKRITNFQVEDGSNRSDHVVTLPVQASVTFQITDEARVTFDRLRQAYQDNRLLIVQSRVASYSPMLIESMPHSETTANIMGLTISARLKEWRTVQPVYGDMPIGTTRNPAQSSTVNRGQQQTTNADGEAGESAKRKGSILSGVFN